jgi:hypothetical protein
VSTPTQRCEVEASRPPYISTPVFFTRDYIVMNEEGEADSEEREVEPEPERPSQHFTHSSTRVG